MHEIRTDAQFNALLGRQPEVFTADDATALLELKPGHYVHFQIDAEGYIDGRLPLRGGAIEWLRRNEKRLRRAISQCLDENFVREWNLDSVFDVCKFRESIVLHSVFLRADQSWELYYDDGGIFGGQILAAETDSAGALKRTYLAA